MKSIEVTYPGIFGQRRHDVKIPSSWNELTADQVTAIAGLLHSGEGDVYRFRIAAIKLLFKMNWMQILAIRDRIVDLYPFIAFLEKENNLTVNPYPFLKVGKIKFYGPIGDFSTLKAEEWTEADTAFIDYKNSGDEQDLDRMIACLFRERQKGIWEGSEHWANDWRRPFNEHTVNLRAQYLSRVDKRIKLGIMIWYQGCRLEWEGVFERVFKGASEDLENFGWQETIQKVSGNTFGDLDKTMSTQMYRIMLHMEISIKDEEIRKEKERHQKLSRR